MERRKGACELRMAVRHYMAVKNLDTAYVACLYGNNESEFFIRKLERDLDMEQDLIKAEQDFWKNYVEKGVLPPYEEAPDLVLDSIRKFVGEPDKKIPEITLDDKNKEGNQTLSCIGRT